MESAMMVGKNRFCNITLGYQAFEYAMAFGALCIKFEE